MRGNGGVFTTWPRFLSHPPSRGAGCGDAFTFASVASIAGAKTQKAPGSAWLPGARVGGSLALIGRNPQNAETPQALRQGGFHGATSRA